MSTRESVLEISYDFELGTEGEDDAPNNPLAKALNTLVSSGKPFKRLSMCFCKGPKGNDQVLRWFGVFIETQANRVVYFPGIVQQPNRVIAHKGSAPKWNQGFSFDHFTLEKDLRSWHITSLKSEDHLGNPPTLSLGKGRVLWFGVSISDFALLREVKKRTIVRTVAPESDSNRRYDVYDKAIDGAIFQILEFHYINEFNPYFLHFGIIAGPKGFPEYTKGNLGFPDGSPFLESSLPTNITVLPMRTHIFTLSERIDLQITATILPGSLSVPISITSQSDHIKINIPFIKFFVISTFKKVFLLLRHGWWSN